MLINIIKTGLGDNMAEYKDVSSPPCMKTPKSQLIAEQTLTKKHWNLLKKISYIQRQRRSHNEMVGGMQLQ